MAEGIRINKYLSEAGICSRRAADEYILKGRITINGKPAEMGQKIEANDRVMVDGKPVRKREETVILAYNKPLGLTCTASHDDPDNIFDHIKYPIRLQYVGRLDKDTVGLLLLTNDGDLNHRLISPKWKVDKVYFAKINQKVTEEDIEKFKHGITLDDGYRCKEAILEIQKASEEGSEIVLTIQEGKFHQVKRMFEAVGKKVTYLKRIEFGTLPLDEDLEEGEYRELTEEELAILKSF